MRVLFDTQTFDHSKYGGIARYYSELIRLFRADQDVELVHPIHWTLNEYLKALPEYAWLKDVQIPNLDSFLGGVRFRGKYKIFSLWQKILGCNNTESTCHALRQGDYDLFHPSYYDIRYLEHIPAGKPFVLTVHDMIHEIFSVEFQHDRTADAKRKLVQRADHVIVISESTQKDLIRILGVSPEKVSVVYQANSLKPVFLLEEQRPQIPAHYILFVGARGTYKNFKTFIEGAAQVLRDHPDLYVVAAGGYSGKTGFSDQELKLFQTLGIEQRVVHVSISDDVLAYLYQHAQCFVFPSLYEGFGLPILEAFACNCPAILSQTSSLPEIGGDAAIYIDPQSPSSIEGALRGLVFNDDARERLRLKGAQRLQFFSWEKTAQETKMVYQKVLGGR